MAIKAKRRSTVRKPLMYDVSGVMTMLDCSV